MTLVSLSTLLFVGIGLRLSTVFISAYNERRLKKMGAIEYGVPNTCKIIILHFLFYGAAIFEGYKNGLFKNDAVTIAGPLSTAGLTIFIFSIVMLFYVIFALRHIWTVKLIIAPLAYHKINRGFLFKLVRHPNYFLNVIPELISLGLIFHAWYALIFIFPVFLFHLLNRIKQEEEVMTQHFSNY